jgi:hypothetical protein
LRVCTVLKWLTFEPFEPFLRTVGALTFCASGLMGRDQLEEHSTKLDAGSCPNRPNQIKK